MSGVPPLRLGFLGVGWIGRNRLEALADSGLVRVAAVADPDEACVAAILAVAPETRRAADLDALLAEDLDGIVIATPSGGHAQETIRALDAGMAVFCQKPLGRTADEVEGVLAAARRADRRLGVDFSYRHTSAVAALRAQLGRGELGRVHAVDLTFHNAWGPDKPWFYDPALSGGGCVMDLGVHLVDLALWLLDARVTEVSADLFEGGRRVAGRAAAEDLALVTLRTEGGAVIRLACSWRLPAGRPAVISAEFYGDRGGAAVRNVDGSFHDLEALAFSGPNSRILAAPPDPWGGRAAVAWAAALTRDRGYDPEVESVAAVAGVLDRIYAAARA